MKQRVKNAQMMIMLSQLRPLLTRRDKFGYMAARNYRILSESLTEYDLFRRDLINKHGEDDKDEYGRSVKIIKMDSPGFKAFCDELAPFNEMEHEVDLMTAKYDETVGCLSGEEILSIDWMLEN